jgi:two-component system, sensor histidine kinase and response regulator
MNKIDKTKDELIQELSALKEENATLKAMFENDKTKSMSVEEKSRIAKKSLAQQQVLLKALMDNISDNIYFKDNKSCFMRISKAQSEKFGLSDPSQALGKTDFDFFMEEHARQAYETEMEILKTGRPLVNFEEKETWPDGSVSWVSTSKSPLYDNDGQIIGTFGISRDITERKLAEEALTQERILLKTLMDNIPDHIYFKDKESRFIRISKAQAGIFGLGDPVDAVGKTDFDFFTEEHARPAFETEMEIIETGRPLVNFEEKETWPDGRVSWVSTTKEPLFDINGQIIGTFGISRDITERKRSEAIIEKRNKELIKLNSEKDKFFSIIAHDLKSPFISLLGLTELMADTTEGFTLAEFIEHSKSLNEIARNLYKLLENLLEWAQIQKGSLNFTPKDSDLSKLVSQSIETITQRAMQKRITIINETGNSQKVFVDEKMIDTVFRNLLSNAVKFTKTDGKIVVKYEQSDSKTIELSISDTGVGIPSSDIKRLFKIEEKVSTRGTDGESSTGLGLLLCKEFIEKHGGKIWVESEVNQGTKFFFTLPLNSSQGET